MVLKVYERSGSAVSSYTHADGLQGSVNALSLNELSVFKKPLSQEERLAHLMREHARMFNALPETYRLRSADNHAVEQLDQSINTSQDFIKTACLPIRGLHEESQMPQCRWLNSVAIMRLRAQDYIQHQIDSLPPPHLSTSSWLPEALRKYFDNRATQVAEQMPSKFMRFAEDAIVLSQVDEETARQLMRRRVSGPGPAPKNTTSEIVMWDWKSNHLIFNQASFDSHGITTKAATKLVRMFKGEALSQPLPPSMKWAQRLHTALVQALEALVTRELCGTGDLPEISRHLLKIVNIDACMEAYFTREPEVLRPLYTAIAFQEANLNIRVVIQKLLSPEQQTTDELGLAQVFNVLDHLSDVKVCSQEKFDEVGRDLNARAGGTSAIINWKPPGLSVYLNQDSKEAEEGAFFTLEAAARLYQNPVVVDIFNHERTHLKPSLVNFDLNTSIHILRNGIAAHLMRLAMPSVQNMLTPDVILMADRVEALMAEQGSKRVLNTVLRTGQEEALTRAQLKDNLSLLLMMLDEREPEFREEIKAINP